MYNYGVPILRNFGEWGIPSIKLPRNSEFSVTSFRGIPEFCWTFHAHTSVQYIV